MTVDSTPATAATVAIETVFRLEFPRLVAGLARRVDDVGLAEDLAQEALADATRAMAPRRRAPQPGCVADGRREAEGGRSIPTGPHAGGKVRAARPAHSRRERARGGGRRRHRRRPPADDVRRVSPGAVDGGPNRVDPPARRRLVDGRDRPRVPATRDHDRATHRAREEEHRRRGRAVRGARGQRASDAVGCGARGDLRHLQRGIHRDHRTRVDAPRSLPRGLAPRPAARAALARRTRGPRARRAHGAAGIAPPRATRAIGRGSAARRSGPAAVGPSPHPPRARGVGACRGAAARSRTVRAASSDRRVPLPTRRASRTPTGSRSSTSTGASRARLRRRSSSSTGPSLCRWRRVRPRPSSSSMRSRRRARSIAITCCTPCAATCSRSSRGTKMRPLRSNGRHPSPETTPSARCPRIEPARAPPAREPPSRSSCPMRRRGSPARTRSSSNGSRCPPPRCTTSSGRSNEWQRGMARRRAASTVGHLGRRRPRPAASSSACGRTVAPTCRTSCSLRSAAAAMRPQRCSSRSRGASNTSRSTASSRSSTNATSRRAASPNALASRSIGPAEPWEHTESGVDAALRALAARS